MDDLFRIILIIFLGLSIFSCNRKTTTTTTATDSTTDVTYSGIWIKDNSTSWYAILDATLDEFSTVNINYTAYRIIDFEVVNVGDETKYSAIYISDGTADTHCIRCEWDTLKSHFDSMKAYYVMAIDYEIHYENGNYYYSMIYADSTYDNGAAYGTKWSTGDDKASFLNMVSSFSAEGYNLIDVEIDNFGENFSGLYTSKPANVLFYWDLDYDTLIDNASTAAENGYYPTDIEIHEINGVKKYNVILNYGSYEWDYLLEGSYEEFNAKNTLMQNTGYRPIDFEVHTSEERNMGRLGDNLSGKDINLVYINPKLKKRNLFK